MNERYEIRQIAIAPRGQKLQTRRTEASRPAHTIKPSAVEPLANHKSVGANQNRSGPKCSATRAKYSPAGSMPWGPMRP